MIPPPPFWDLKRWWWSHPFMTPFLLPLSWPSRVAQDSTVNKSSINMMVPSKVTVCFFNLGSWYSLRKAIQVSAVILIPFGIFHQPTIIPLIMIPPPPFWDLKRCSNRLSYQGLHKNPPWSKLFKPDHLLKSTDALLFQVVLGFTYCGTTLPHGGWVLWRRNFQLPLA